MFLAWTEVKARQISRTIKQLMLTIPTTNTASRLWVEGEGQGYDRSLQGEEDGREEPEYWLRVLRLHCSMDPVDEWGDVDEKINQWVG